MGTPLSSAVQGLSDYHHLIRLPKTVYREVKDLFATYAAEGCIMVADQLREVPVRTAATNELDRVFHHISRELTGGLVEEAIDILIDENFPELKKDPRFRLFLSLSLGVVRSQITGDVLHGILRPVIPCLAEKLAVAPYKFAMGHVFDIGAPAVATLGASTLVSTVCAGAASAAGVCEAISTASTVVSAAKTLGYGSGLALIANNLYWSSAQGAKTRERVERIITKIIDKYGSKFTREEIETLRAVNVEDHQPNTLIATLTEILVSDKTKHIVQRLALASGRALLKAGKEEAHHQVASLTSEPVAALVDAAASSTCAAAVATVSHVGAAVASLTEGPSRPMPAVVEQAIGVATDAGVTAGQFLASTITNSAIRELTAKLISDDKLDLLLDTVELLIDHATLHHEVKGIIKAKTKEAFGRIPLIQELKEVLRIARSAQETLSILRSSIRILPISESLMGPLLENITRIESCLRIFNDRLSPAARIIAKIESDDDLDLRSLMEDFAMLETEIQNGFNAIREGVSVLSVSLADLFRSCPEYLNSDILRSFANLSQNFFAQFESLPRLYFVPSLRAVADLSAGAASSSSAAGAAPVENFGALKRVFAERLSVFDTQMTSIGAEISTIQTAILAAETSLNPSDLDASSIQLKRLTDRLAEIERDLLSSNTNFKKLLAEIIKILPTGDRLTAAFYNSIDQVRTHESSIAQIKARLARFQSTIDSHKPSAIGSLFSGIYGYFGGPSPAVSGAGAASTPPPAALSTSTIAPKATSVFSSLTALLWSLKGKPSSVEPVSTGVGSMGAATTPSVEATISAGLTGAGAATTADTVLVVNQRIVAELLKPECQAMIRDRFPKKAGSVGKGPGELLITLLLELQKSGDFSDTNPRLKSIRARLADMDLGS